ncbi:acetyltransferase [Holdemanella biformis]|uniref:acetyltransferase n=1 Tax=Holdemanella biformis TaxID=1735 RepID=UPI003AB111F6
MKRLVIIGASGHGKVIADIAEKNGYSDIVFLDDNGDIKECAGYPVIGKTVDAFQINGDKFVAIGNSQVRERILKKIANPVTLIHPNAVISRRVEIGDGTVIMAGAIINSDTRIGNGVIINTGSSVDHDCEIDDYCHISVGAHIAGTVVINKNTWIGAGATVINNVNICNNCMIGAGALVLDDIKERGTYVGVPVKRLDK